MDEETVITLSVRQTAARSFIFRVLINGEIAPTAESLLPLESQAISNLSLRYSEIFDQSDREASILLQKLQRLGTDLFNMWLAPAWEQVIARVKVSARPLLVIASNVSHALNLPWELLRPPNGDFIGLDPKFSIRRVPWPDRSLALFAGKLPPRPLRILFMACAPTDQPPLDYEREEEFLLRAIAKAGPNVAFDLGDLGTFEELRQRINEFQPHIVHLTGHGFVRDSGLSYFAFEDEQGGTDPCSSAKISREAFAGSSVQCAFISGCETGKAPPIAALGGICQGLVREELPLAIGWAASIADDIANRFASIFYNTLSAGQTVDRAIIQARHAIYKECEERGDASWALPVLYSATTQGLIFDASPQRAAAPPLSRSRPLEPLPGMTEGYAEHFVGRRRELQRLLPALTEGGLRTVVITGIGGVGKSTLATRVARRLESNGFTPIAVPSSREIPLTAARLLQICGDTFLAANLREAYTTSRNPDIPVNDRLRHIVTVLNQNRFVFVIDNFEVNMTEGTRHIIDRQLRGFYTHLLTHLTGDSRCIVTCRYLPAEVDPLPSVVHEEPLGDLSGTGFFKVLMRDSIVEHRYYTGELPHDLLSELHRLLGGTPRFLAQIREVLKKITASDLQEELDAITRPGNGKVTLLDQLRDQYCEQIFVARLYGSLSPDSQKALSKAAVYGVPITLVGLAGVTGKSIGSRVGAEHAIKRIRGFVREWKNCALAHPEPGRGSDELWTIYSLLRGWLLAPERLHPDERQAANKSAGHFLWLLGSYGRANELGLSVVDCLRESQFQYLAARECELARMVTKHLTDNYLSPLALYDEIVMLNEKLLQCEEHPEPMRHIGWAYRERGDFAKAREWLQRSHKLALSMCKDQEVLSALMALASIDKDQDKDEDARKKGEDTLRISERVNDASSGGIHRLVAEAVLLLDRGDYKPAREHFNKILRFSRKKKGSVAQMDPLYALAFIDRKEKKYGNAHKKYEKILRISRRRNDLSWEATVFCELGLLAEEQGRNENALKFLLLGSILLDQIGHVDFKRIQPLIADMISRLNLTLEQVEALREEVTSAYRQDRGWRLVRAK